MKTNLIIFVTAILLACTSSPKNTKRETGVELDTLLHINTSPNEPITPVYGYRFMITGDFNGDQKQDTLKEHFISQLDNKDSPKFYRNLPDYDDLVDTTVKKAPLSYVSSSNKKIDTLFIAASGQLLGLSYLKNEGDLDGDGRDEVSYVVNWADWSNLNTWHIVSYKKGQWINLYSFSIWDWQLPSLPETWNQYGYFGLVNKTVIDSTTYGYDEITEAFLAFPGLLKKVKNNVIEIIYMNSEAMLDTAQIDLRTKKYM